MTLKRGGMHSKTDTQIFRTPVDTVKSYLSIRYRGARRMNCITAHNNAQLIHAILTHCCSRARMAT